MDKIMIRNSIRLTDKQIYLVGVFKTFFHDTLDFTHMEVKQLFSTIAIPPRSQQFFTVIMQIMIRNVKRKCVGGLKEYFKFIYISVIKPNANTA